MIGVNCRSLIIVVGLKAYCCYETIDYKAFPLSVHGSGVTGLCAGCRSLLFQNDGYPERSFAEHRVSDLQDRKGFMWFGTKDGLNRYDGLSFRVYKKENSGLGKNFITALYEDCRGNIWIGTDGGVFIYDPVLDFFTAFDEASDSGSVIRDFVTMIGSDEDDNIWISVENQGLFCYRLDEGKLLNRLHDSGLPNVTRFWLNGNTCWLALYADNLYYTKS